MSKHFKSTIDLEPIRAGVTRGSVRGLTLATEHVLTEANKAVPHDEGTLERSGSADVDTNGLRGAVSYDTPYAVRQHEDMTLSHDGKGQAKWLETTLNSEGGTVAKIVQQAIRSELGT